MAQSNVEKLLDKLAAQLKGSEIATQEVFKKELKPLFQSLGSSKLRDALLANFDKYADLLWAKYSAEDSQSDDLSTFFTSTSFDSFLKRSRSGSEYRSVLLVPGCPFRVKEKFVRKSLDASTPELVANELFLVQPFGTSQDPKLLTQEMELAASYYSQIPPTSETGKLLGLQLARYHMIHSNWSNISREVEIGYKKGVAQLLAECLRCGCATSDFTSKVGMFAEQARSLLLRDQDLGGVLELISLISQQSFSSSTSASSASSSSVSSSSSSSSTLTTSSSLAAQKQVLRNLLVGIEPLLVNAAPAHSLRLALVAMDSAPVFRDCFEETGKHLASNELPKDTLTILNGVGQKERHLGALFSVPARNLKLALAQLAESAVELPVDKKKEQPQQGKALQQEQPEGEGEDMAFFVDTAGANDKVQKGQKILYDKKPIEQPETDQPARKKSKRPKRSGLY